MVNPSYLYASSQCDDPTNSAFYYSLCTNKSPWLVQWKQKKCKRSYTRTYSIVKQKRKSILSGEVGEKWINRSTKGEENLIHSTDNTAGTGTRKSFRQILATVWSPRLAPFRCWRGGSVIRQSLRKLLVQVNSSMAEVIRALNFILWLSPWIFFFISLFWIAMHLYSLKLRSLYFLSSEIESLLQPDSHLTSFYQWKLKMFHIVFPSLGDLCNLCEDFSY